MSEPNETPILLFVDDEKDILAGLRSTLRKRRQDWDMHFAIGARAALEVVADLPVDVIVSDMRMPGKDGASFLAEAREIRPEAVRIVLSGHADDGATMRGLAVAQQWLAKPCARDQLLRSLELALTARRLIRDTEKRMRLGGIESLPSPPATLEHIQFLVADPDCRIQDLAETIEQDPAVAAKILQLANSSFFNLAQEVTSLEAAIPRLGLDTIAALVVSESVFQSVARKGNHPVSEVEALQRHSLLCARLSGRIAREVALGDEQLLPSAFTSGLLHDVGRLLVIGTEWEGEDCAALGAGLLAAWGLPMRIVESVARHQALFAIPGEPDLASVCVHAAHHLLCEIEEKLVRGVHGPGSIDPAVPELLGGEPDLETLRQMASDFFDLAAEEGH
ncbi:MAG: HDOD domain-containing protein [Myxococcota bacterium]